MMKIMYTIDHKVGSYICICHFSASGTFLSSKFTPQTSHTSEIIRSYGSDYEGHCVLESDTLLFGISSDCRETHFLHFKYGGSSRFLRNVRKWRSANTALDPRDQDDL